MRLYKSILLILFIILCGGVRAQTESLLEPGRVIFYNVENLFDTIDNPETNDEEFLPESKREWDTKKYKIKLAYTARVLASMLDTIDPIMIGLAEVENRKVLEDLIAQPSLKKFNLGIVHHDSPDERGIDVALLYNKDVINEVFDAFLRVKFPFDPNDRTRDIVYFQGYMTEDEPVYFFVNHWPSRWGGKEESEPKRLAAATVLKNKIEDIYKGDPNAHVIIMGDFNDNPDEKSVQLLCSEPHLANLMTPLKAKGDFTLKYKGEPDVFDQFIVSENLLTHNDSYFVSQSSAHIYKTKWLLYRHKKYGLIPNRTYVGTMWVGGFSDHLPVYLDIGFH